MATKARTTPATGKIRAREKNPLENLQVTYEKNKKPINTIITVALVAIVGFFAYKKLYQEPRNNKAATQLSYAQRYFEVDSVQRALNGDGQRAGFLRIISKFGGTSSANLAHYYAGISYLKMGDFKNAIKHLEDFDGGGTQVQYAAYGALGDAYMENGNTKKGIEYYNKAAENKDNIGITPFYLFRAGLAYEMANQPEAAKKAYKRIRDEYPQSMQAREVDKYLARLGELD